MFARPLRTLAIAAAAAAGTAATQAHAEDSLRLTATANVRGSVASLACGRTGTPPTTCNLDATLHRAREAGDLLVDAGHFLGASFLASEAIRRNPALFADLVEHLGYRALALEHRDLNIDRALLVAFARALGERGIPLVLSNLSCDPEAEAVCDNVLDARATGATFDTPGGLVAFVAVIDPTIFHELPEAARAGLRLEDPVKALDHAVREARAAGARYIVAAYEPNPASDIESTFRFLQAIDDDEDAPDVLLVDRLAEHLTRLDRPRSRLRVVATRPGGAVSIRGDEVSIPEGVPEDADRFTRTWAADFDATLCRNLGVPLPGGSLRTPFGRREFREYAADVLRRDLGADLAIVSRETYGSGVSWPLEDHLTLLDIHAALPFSGAVGTVALDGATIKRLFDGVTSIGFVTRGYDSAKGTVNGRALDDTRRYTVATTQSYFDQAIAKNAVFREGASGFDGRNLRDLVLADLANEDEHDPRAHIGKPEESTAWAFRAALRGNMQTTRVANSDATRLTDSQLGRSDALALSFDLDTRADADEPRWSLTNVGRMRYGVTHSGGTVTETRDTIDHRSNFVFKQTRGAMTPPGVPNLAAELFVETEASRPDNRAYRHLLLRPSVGLSFTLAPPATLQVGLGFDWEVFASREQLIVGGALPLMPASIATLMVKPSPLFTIGARSATIEGSLDYARRNPFTTSEVDPKGVEFRGRVKLVAPVSRLLALTSTYDLFGRRAWAPSLDGGEGSLVLGVAHDLSIGLEVALSGQISSYGR